MVPSEPSRSHPSGGGSRAVLVVDDNTIMLRLIAAQLALLGYRADTVESGHVALERLSSGRYDAILMDVQMPGIDGLETTRRLRVLEGSRRHTPVIAVTASEATDTRARCLAAGMDDFLAKPVRAGHLGELLARWLDGRPTAAANSAPSAPVEELLDANQIDTLRRLGILARVVPIFLKTLPERLAAIGAAVEAQDLVALRKAAHALRGSAGQLGAVAIFRHSGALEDAAITGDRKACEQAIDALGRITPLVVARLEALIA